MRALLSSIVMSLIGSLAAGATVYTGSLTSADGLFGLSSWSADATLSWSVDDMTTAGAWHYEYTLSVPKKSISHAVVETSSTLTTADIRNFQWSANGSAWKAGQPELGRHSESNGNPNIPDSLFGLKFDTSGESLELQIRFDTIYSPVWGDAYAKSGKGVALWNRGFTPNDTDPAFEPANGSVNYHALVPGSSPLPEPATLGLLGAGLLTLIRRRRA